MIWIIILIFFVAKNTRMFIARRGFSGLHIENTYLYVFHRHFLGVSFRSFFSSLMFWISRNFIYTRKFDQKFETIGPFFSRFFANSVPKFQILKSIKMPTIIRSKGNCW